MARVLGLFPAALNAARNGMTANAFYRELRAEGIAPSRQITLQLFKVAKGVVTRDVEEPFRNQQAIPFGQEVRAWPSKSATGIAQTVTITYRNKVTNTLEQTWWRTVTPAGITRERAVEMAVASYNEHSSEYDQEFLGAVHTSAYRLVPGLIA